jgi:NAD(P)-dependent dehydrogenase (short-subunit alcohol dehydrogenase family)
MMKNTLIGLAAAGAGWFAAKAARRRTRRLDLTGRVVAITGGSRGLGLTLARQFAGEGARLAIAARTEADLEQAATELRGRGAEVVSAKCNVSEPSAAEAFIDQTCERFGRLDVLVNNAGVIQVGPREHMQRADFEEAMDVHFWGTYNMTEAALPHMERGARIINIASIGGLVAVPHLLPYSASKFALVGYSDGLRAELAEYGIDVTTVAPGLMRTGSHVNAFFKGQHEREYAWFSISNALPVLSMSAERAAAKIVRACRCGDPSLTLTGPAKLAARVSRLAPDLLARSMALASRLLPAPDDPEGDRRRKGRDSFSAWSPSWLTAPADRAVSTYNEQEGAPSPATDGS